MAKENEKKGARQGVHLKGTLKDLSQPSFFVVCVCIVVAAKPADKWRMR